MPSKPKTTSEQANVILRELPQDRAFNFYRSVGVPLNIAAKSLNEFVERIESVEPASLVFHTERQDFERWISMLGDTELAKKLGTVRMARLQGEALRTRLYSTTKSRLDQLSRLSMGISR
jgi:Family of unknown function (DUF5752)